VGKSCKPACNFKKQFKKSVGDAGWGNCILRTQWRSWRVLCFSLFGVVAQIGVAAQVFGVATQIVGVAAQIVEHIYAVAERDGPVALVGAGQPVVDD
jgi:hypothetical protein